MKKANLGRKAEEGKTGEMRTQQLAAKSAGVDVWSSCPEVEYQDIIWQTTAGSKCISLKPSFMKIRAFV